VCRAGAGILEASFPPVDAIVSRSTLPLRRASLIGVALSVLAVLAIAVYLMLWLT